MEEEKLASEISYEEIVDCLGQDEAEIFTGIMTIVNSIIDNPESHSGLRAIHMANRLAAFRIKIGVRAQHYKAHYAQDKSLLTKRRKYLTEMMYSAVEEQINTLKLLGRVDARLT